MIKNGKEFFVHGNRGRKPVYALSMELKDEIKLLYTSRGECILAKY